MRFELGQRVRLGAYGSTGTIEAFTVNGWPIVRWDWGLVCRAEPGELAPVDDPHLVDTIDPSGQACPECGAVQDCRADCPTRDASPDEAARIMRELHELTSAPAPEFDVPFTLNAQVSRGASSRARQGGLFDAEN